MTLVKLEFLSDSTPKAILLSNACHLAVDALRAAHSDLRSNWNTFLTKDGTFGQSRKRKAGDAKEVVPKRRKKQAATKTLNVQENAITSELQGPIRRFLFDKQIHDSTHVTQISCHIEAHVPSDVLTGDQLKNADIRFELLCNETCDSDIVIEAKVLRDKSDIENVYLGVDGLQRFCRQEEPYSTAPLAGLLAYVSDAEHTQYLADVYEKAQKIETCQDSKWAPIGIAKPTKELFTMHECENLHRENIWMLHLMMKFPSMHKEVSV